MSGKRYPEEFKIEAVKQVTERGHAATEVAARLGVSSHSLYQWVKRYSAPPAERQKVDDQQAEMKRLKAELKRVTEERDILKKAAVSSTGERNSSDLMAFLWRCNAKNWKTRTVCAAEKRVVGSMEGRPVLI